MAINIPTELVDAYKDGRLKLFIGSGVSSAAGLISWDDLIKQMSQTIKDENNQHSKKDIEQFLKHGDHTDIAELFKETVGDRQYFRYLRNSIRKDVKPAQVHKSIKKLTKVKTIFTTNYDKLLETVLRTDLLQDPLTIVYPQQLGFENADELKIIKLHGDIDHPNTIILTRKDYAEYNNKHKEFELKLKDSIANSTLLFVGFGLRDHNFMRIFNDSRSFYDSVNHKSFAIMVGTQSVERQLWDKDKLRIIEVGAYNKIQTVLNQLSKK